MEIVDYDLWEVPPRWQLLRLETATGEVGWGEPVVEGRPKATAAAVEELLEGYLMDQPEVLDVERHWQAMYRGGFYRGGPVLMSALSGIDQALWDLRGKHYGAPVYELLGGRARDRVRLYQHVRGETPAEVASDAEEQVAAGFTAVKTTPTQELRRVDTPAAVADARERVAAIREAVGADVDVALDFHGRVSKSMAKRLAVALEEYEPMFYEEPVLAEQNESLADIAQHTSISIATGERMFSRWDFKDVLETVDVIQPDLSHAGGITEVKKIAAMAEAYDVALAPHSPLGPVSFAASLHIDALAPNALVQEQVLHRERVPTYLADESVIAHDDGFVDLPSGDGLGVDIDVDALDAAETEWAWEVPEWRHDDGSVAEW